MTEMYAWVFVGAVQILLSINLVLRRKNKIAVMTEILSSFLLFGFLNGFTFNVSYIDFELVIIALLEYICVKLFLIVFMLIARIYSFYYIKKICNRRVKTNKKRIKTINKFSKINYWPKLKFGIPAKAGKRHPVTNVAFDNRGFPKFKSYYTVKLRRKDYKKTREQHFYIANKQLYKAILSSSRLRAKFSKQEIKKLSNGETPSRYTWHHHQDAGILQLVEYDVHAKTSHIGGYSLWGE